MRLSPLLVYLMFTSCLPHVYLMFTSCLPHVYLMFTSVYQGRRPNVYLMFTSCLPHVYLMFTSHVTSHFTSGVAKGDLYHEGKT